ncbi:MAG: hypothetical protein ACJ8AT_12270 [Hyalangium sp.]|uniref:hypothetical protein n=1 Tax=Hyalangium sp. TaxID=2028555 RepID=UPI003899E2F8
MDPFWEKVVLALIDKGLLAMVGTGLTYLVTRAIEKYRRTQAMVLELGKARAAAYIRIISALTELQTYLDDYLIMDKSDPKSPKLAELSEKIAEVSAEVQKIVRRESALIEKEVGHEIDEYAQAIVRLKESVTTLTPAQFETRRASLREIRYRLLRYLPPLTLPD